MMLTFFPWWTAEREYDVEGFSLIPRHRVRLKKNASTSDKAAAHTLRSYRINPKRPVQSVTLVEIAGRERFADLDNDERYRLFAFREALTFTALAGRKLFAHDGYWNADCFRMIIQGFTTGETIAKVSRRRDGQTMGFGSASLMLELMPSHVEPPQWNPDIALLSALLKAVAKAKTANITAAMYEFNSANTDGPNIAEYLELVPMVSAFQTLLGAGTAARDLGEAFHREWTPTKRMPLARCTLGTAKTCYAFSYVQVVARENQRW